MILILYYIKYVGELILLIWGMFLYPMVGIPLLQTIGRAETVSCVDILVLYLGINGYVTLIAIVVIHMSVSKVIWSVVLLLF
jgi:hypothetical protein